MSSTSAANDNFPYFTPPTIVRKEYPKYRISRVGPVGIDHHTDLDLPSRWQQRSRHTCIAGLVKQIEVGWIEQSTVNPLRRAPVWVLQVIAPARCCSVLGSVVARGQTFCTVGAFNWSFQFGFDQSIEPFDLRQCCRHVDYGSADTSHSSLHVIPYIELPVDHLYNTCLKSLA